MSIEASCNDCGHSIDCGELTYCESCFINLKDQVEKCLEKIDELEDKISDLEKELPND